MEHGQRLLPLPRLLATHRRSKAQHIGFNSRFKTNSKYGQRQKCHCLAFSHTLLAAHTLNAFAFTCASGMALNKASACCHCPPFSQALLAELQLMTSASGMAWNNASACCHCLPFSQALIIELRQITSTCAFALGVARNKTSASLLPQALTALVETTMYEQFGTLADNAVISSKHASSHCPSFEHIEIPAVHSLVSACTSFFMNTSGCAAIACPRLAGRLSICLSGWPVGHSALALSGGTFASPPTSPAGLASL